MATSTVAFTFLGDGPSDRRLMPVLQWAMAQKTSRPVTSTWADLGFLERRPRTLAERIAAALDFYPCEILFVHRDAEKEPRSKRVAEIGAALPPTRPPHVCVVPVRMQEAWLLFDEPKIRLAAKNPSGTMPLGLPRLGRLERVPAPKLLLNSALRAASGLNARRRASFDTNKAAYRLASLIDDYSALTCLPAFRAMLSEVDAALLSLRTDISSVPRSQLGHILLS